MLGPIQVPSADQARILHDPLKCLDLFYEQFSILWAFHLQLLSMICSSATWAVNANYPFVVPSLKS
jgi:hypothetical protein